MFASETHVCERERERRMERTGKRGGGGEREDIPE